MRSTSGLPLAGLCLLSAGILSGIGEGSKAADRVQKATADSAEIIDRGRELFERVWKPDDPRSHAGDGLGPVFNAQSCVACHDRGGVGGAGGVERNIEIATASPGFGGSGYQFSYSFGMDFGTGRFEYRLGNGAPAATGRKVSAIDSAVLAAVHPGFRESRSVMIHRFGTDPGYHAWRAGVAGTHGGVSVQVSERNPTPLFGLGLIDGIPDEVIEAGAKRKPANARIKGRVSRLKDGSFGRFGWKAQTATLADFVRSAAAGEIGLELPGKPQASDPQRPGVGASGLDLVEEDCEALTAYVRSLPAPVVLEPADDSEKAQLKSGESTFKAIGCAGCHTPDLGDVQGIYSDLLLHEMSQRLADTGSYGVFSGPQAAPAAAGGGDRESDPANELEWRTPPLWGLRDSAPYLHDGRAATVDQAIAQHGGQGSTSAQRYSQLSPKRKQQLTAFLLSLTAPGPVK